MVPRAEVMVLFSVINYITLEMRRNGNVPMPDLREKRLREYGLARKPGRASGSCYLMGASKNKDHLPGLRHGDAAHAAAARGSPPVLERPTAAAAAGPPAAARSGPGRHRQTAFRPLCRCVPGVVGPGPGGGHTGCGVLQ